MLWYCIKKAVKKLIVVALLASSLNACSLPQVKPTDALEPEKGFVIVRIVNNVDFIFSLTTSWDELRISEAREDGRLFTLRQVDLPTTKSTQTFSAQLPQGTYTLSHLHLFVGNYKMWAPLDKLGTFKVAPGHITNLGTIIYQPTGGRRYQLIYTNTKGEVQELMKSNYPVINNNAAGKEMIGWDNKSLLENIVIAPSDYLKSLESGVTQKNILYKSTALSFAKENSAGFNNPRQILSGEIFAGRKLGQILVKERNGKWTQLDTGYTREITAVLPINRSTIYAGGEEGLLLLTIDGGRSWKRIVAPYALGVVLFLEQFNGQFIIGTILNGRFRVYETMDIQNNNWKSSLDAEFFYSRWGTYWKFTSYSDNSKLYLFVPGKFIYVLDLTTNNWNVINTPFMYSSIYSYKNSFFYALSPSSKPHISHDLGNSWLPINYPSRMGVAIDNPVFLDNINGFVLIFKVLPFNVTLRKTQDGGKNWEEVNDFNDLKLPHATKLFYDYVNNKLYFAVDGMIYIASDDLKNWTRVVRE